MVGAWRWARFLPFGKVARATYSALVRLPAGRGRAWAITGIVLVGIGFVLFMGFSFVRFMSQSKLVPPYGVSVAQLIASREASAELGAPIAVGVPTGTISVGDDGHPTASLHYSVKGPKANGTVFVDASRDADSWKVERLQLQIENHPNLISID